MQKAVDVSWWGHVRLEPSPASPCYGVLHWPEEPGSRERGLCDVLTLLPEDQLSEPIKLKLIHPTLHLAHQTVSISTIKPPQLLPQLPHPTSSVKLQMSPVFFFFEESRNSLQYTTPEISFSPPSHKMCLTQVDNNKSPLTLFVDICFLSALSSVFWLD